MSELIGHTNHVHSVTFSPDGTRLASGSGDNTIRIWDTVTPSIRHQQAQTALGLRREMTPIVDRLLEEHGEPSIVAEHLRSDETIDESHRRAALRALLIKSQDSPGAPPPAADAGN